MKKIKCPNCKNENINLIDKNLKLCLDCGHSISSINKKTSMEKLISIREKNINKKSYNQKMQKLQKEHTQKRYLHFQFRIL
jgi:ribosomal protein L37AE/L43A